MDINRRRSVGKTFQKTLLHEMDHSSIALVQEFVNNLRNIMEMFANFSSDTSNCLPQPSCTPIINIENLKKQIEQFKDELRKHDIRTSDDIDNGIEGNTGSDQKDKLEKENLQLKNEVTHLREEMCATKKKLDDETLSRKRLEVKYFELRKSVETSETICDTEYFEKQTERKDTYVDLSPDIHNSDNLIEFEKNCQTLSKDEDCYYNVFSDVCDYMSDELDCRKHKDAGLMSEDKRDGKFNFEKVTNSSRRKENENEKELLRTRNVDLERQLIDEKRRNRSNEKRLLVYSQLNDPSGKRNSRNLETPRFYRSSHSAPTSPCDKNTEQSLFRKYYDEAKTTSGVNVKRQHKHTKKSNSCDSISTNCNDQTAFSSFNSNYYYGYHELEVVARGRKSDR